MIEERYEKHLHGKQYLWFGIMLKQIHLAVVVEI
jgi:hypothetical protein